MVSHGLLLHSSSRLLGSAQHPKGCETDCHPPYLRVLFQHPLASAKSGLWLCGSVLGSGTAVPRPFAVPRGRVWGAVLPASASWRRGHQDEPSFCLCTHRMEMQPDKSVAIYTKR